MHTKTSKGPLGFVSISKHSERSNFLPSFSRPNRGTRESAAVPYKTRNPRLRTLAGDHRDHETCNSTRTNSSHSLPIFFFLSLFLRSPVAKCKNSRIHDIYFRRDREREPSSRGPRSPYRAETSFRASALELPNYAAGLLTPFHSFVVQSVPR